VSLEGGTGKPRPTIGQAAAQAWRDTHAALRALSGPAQVVFFIYLVLSVARRLLLPTDPLLTTATLLGEFILSIAQAFLLTPFLIAVHRFVILGESTRYTLAPGEHRFQLFFMWSIALSLLAWFPPFLISSFPVRPSPAFVTAFVVGCLIYVVAATIISLRLIVLFPAIAVDAPGATWRNAMADTKGSAWRILFIGLLASLPLVGLALVLALVALSIGPPGVAARPSIGWIAVTSITDAVFCVIGFTIAVAVASRLYEQLANRLNQPV
jgi:hypothetical protein